MARSGLSREDAVQRIAAQWPMTEKARRAHHVIDTSGSFDQTDKQVRAIWAKLQTEAALRL
jgi:dephospho-CoA kinase